MNRRDKLQHAPRALAAYDRHMAEQRRMRRLDTTAALLTIGALIGFAALPFILWIGEWLP